MKLIPKQYDQISDVFKEASAVVLGGLIIGTILSEKPNFGLVIVGIVIYIASVVLSVYLKKRGE